MSAFAVDVTYHGERLACGLWVSGWMSSMSERQLFQHPLSHNIEWRAVVSLLEAVGSVVEHHDGTVAVTVGSQTAFFDPPPHKDIDTDVVVGLRRMLNAAGYGAEVD